MAKGPPTPREVAVALPFRIGTSNTVEFLLVSSRKHPNAWVFPKGGVEDGEQPAEAAAREAWEEGGVRGTIVRQLHNSLDLSPHKRSPAASVSASSPARPFTSKASYTFFSLRVDGMGLVDDWPEKRERQRRWVPGAEARELIAWRGDGQIDALDILTGELLGGVATSS